MRACVCAYACVHACVNARLYACQPVRTFASKHVRTQVCMHASLRARMNACAHVVTVCACLQPCAHAVGVCMQAHAGSRIVFAEPSHRRLCCQCYTVPTLHHSTCQHSGQWLSNTLIPTALARSARLNGSVGQLLAMAHRELSWCGRTRRQPGPSNPGLRLRCR